MVSITITTNKNTNNDVLPIKPWPRSTTRNETRNNYSAVGFHRGISTLQEIFSWNFVCEMAASEWTLIRVSECERSEGEKGTKMKWPLGFKGLSFSRGGPKARQMAQLT